MTFEEYLESKKIDTLKLKEMEPALYSDWESSFNQMHPNSFTAQKLYLINSIRRRFPKQADNKIQS